MPSAGPLAGLKVVDLTAFQNGPSATVQMADNGADVVKVLVPLLRPRGSSTLERLWGRRVLVPLLRARGSLALLKSRATSRSGPADKLLASVLHRYGAS